VKEHAFAHFDADRLAVAKHLSVDAKQVVPDFITLWAAELRVGLLTNVLQLLYGCFEEKIHCHVAASTERRQEFLEHQEDFEIVGTRIIHRLDIKGPRLSGIRAEAEIIHRNDMGVVEVETRRLWLKGNAAHAMRRNVRGAFLRGAVNIEKLLFRDMLRSGIPLPEVMSQAATGYSKPSVAVRSVGNTRCRGSDTRMIEHHMEGSTSCRSHLDGATKC
jgi:hypothetical protein